MVWIEANSRASARPLQFLLDTGATVSVLDSQACAEMNLKAGEPVLVAGVKANVTGRWPTDLCASAEGIMLPEKWLVLDLGELSRACGRRIDGLIGADFLKGRVIELDFANSILNLRPFVSLDRSDMVLPLRRTGTGALLTKVSVDRRFGWVRLDTGFAGSLEWVERKPKAVPERERISVGLARISTPVACRSVRLGRVELPSTPIGSHDQAIFPGESGLLGNQILSKFKVSIDEPGKRLVLRPASREKSSDQK